jgi:hypothetical protein
MWDRRSITGRIFTMAGRGDGAGGKNRLKN